MPDAATDERFMRRALDLARAGIGLASPNPHVGSVVVNDLGEILGSGTHTYEGIKHAEILAIEQAGPRARAATLYVNLEPCSHHGRTGPCADAVIAAGIQRVVVAMQDPNPEVSGKGISRIRDAGIAVDVGLLQDESRRLNEAFAKYIRTGSPLVTLKSALTFDGKIAPPPGSPREWITGEAARAHVQELRHQHDAILVGIGTVLVDDPLLTDRSAQPRRRPLLRVVLDSRLRLPLESQIVQTANNDVLVFYVDGEQSRIRQLEEKGIRLALVPRSADGRTDLEAVCRRLGELQIVSLLIEGGSSVNRATLGAQVVDKVFFYYAPMIFGRNSVRFAADSSFPDLVPPPYPKLIRLHKFGADIAVEGYLRDPYGEEI